MSPPPLITDCAEGQGGHIAQRGQERLSADAERNNQSLQRARLINLAQTPSLCDATSEYLREPTAPPPQNPECLLTEAGGYKAKYWWVCVTTRHARH